VDVDANAQWSTCDHGLPDPKNLTLPARKKPDPTNTWAAFGLKFTTLYKNWAGHTIFYIETKPDLTWKL